MTFRERYEELKKIRGVQTNNATSTQTTATAATSSTGNGFRERYERLKAERGNNALSVAVLQAQAQAKAEQEEAEKARLRAFDVNAAEARRQEAQRERDAAYTRMNSIGSFGVTATSGDPQAGRKAARKQSLSDSARADYDRLGTEIDTLTRDINAATKEQARSKYDALPSNADFELYSGYNPKNRDGLYQYINGVGRDRMEANPIDGAAVSYDPYKKYQNLSDLDRKKYNYLTYVQGARKALEFLEFLDDDLRQEKYEQDRQAYRDYGYVHPVFGSILSVPTNLIGGVIGTADFIGRQIAGVEQDPYSWAQLFSSGAQDIRSGASEDMGSLGKFLYNTAMSAADSLVAGKVLPGKHAPAVLLSSTAFSSGAQDLRDRGANDQQILTGALAAATFEWMFESISIGNFKSMQEVPVTGVMDFIGNLAKSSGVNFTEEALTELSNIVWDTATMGDISQFKIAENQYIDAGYSPEKAHDKVIGDMALRVLEAGASGMLMGFGFGGIGSVQSAVNNQTAQVTKQGKQVAKDGGYDALIQQALNLPVESNAHQIAQGLVDGDTKQSNWSVGVLSQAVQREIAQQEISKAASKYGQYGQEMFKAAAEMHGLNASELESVYRTPYEMGLRNEEADRSQMTPVQQQAYLAGRMDALENEQQTGYTDITKEEINNGEEVHLRRGSQWDDGSDSAGVVSELEEGAGRDQGWQEQGRPADGEAARLAHGKEVTVSSLGITGGSTQSRVWIPKKDTAEMAKARKAAKQRGLKVVFFGGNNLDIKRMVEMPDGTRQLIDVSARAYISGGRVFVRVDHAEYTADQLMRHEIGHDKIEKGEINPNEVRDRIEREFEPGRAQRIIEMYEEAYRGSNMTPEQIWEEVICDSLGDMNIFAGMSQESAAHELLTATKAKTRESNVARNKGPPDGEAMDSVSVGYDSKTNSAHPGDYFSQETWTKSEYVTNRKEAAADLAGRLGISERKAKAYIDSINSIAKAIADDQQRLDYVSSWGKSAFVGNVEYGGSFDFTTLCPKRAMLTGTFSAIQRALPNTALTANEILEIRQKMVEKGIVVNCGLCYVEGSRANMGTFTKAFIDLYKKHNPGAWAPNMAEMNTPDGIEWVRTEHPEVYEQYEYFWNHYGTLKDGDPKLFASQQKPKLYQLHTAYKNEILDDFKAEDKDKVDSKNKNGGIRLQSFSDFEIVHLIDTMQVIMDMSRVGLAGQAYTKMPDFAWALGNTGLKINLSLIAKDVDADGHLIFDEREGMELETAMQLRDTYSKNVGTILVVFNDKQLKAAMADSRIDFIIPFHRSQWKRSQYEAMGLPANTKDYTYQQNEKFIKKTYHEYRGRMVLDKATNYKPNEYWDFSKSGKENAEAYLKMCAENNKRPKFYRLLQNNGDGSYSLQPDGSTDGYWKLLIDFKMYDNNGNGSPQMPVRPDFNMEEAHRMLNEYKGGHQQFPVAHGIVDEFVANYKATHKGGKFSQELPQKQKQTTAPTFYSKMERVMEASKTEKWSASAVVPMLKNNGVKAEEIKWSGIETFLEGKKSVTKQELLEFMAGNRLQIDEDVRTKDFSKDAVQLKRSGIGRISVYVDGELIDTLTKKHGEWIPDSNPNSWYPDKESIAHSYSGAFGKHKRHHKFALDGGTNYREIVFKLPNSNYTNLSMRGHWGRGASGIIAHARYQDMDVDGKKMLFVEEIQSDWHNLAKKQGGYKGQRTETDIRNEAADAFHEFYNSDIIQSIEDRLTRSGYGNTTALIDGLFEGEDWAKYDLMDYIGLTEEESAFIENASKEEASRQEELTKAPSGPLDVPDAPFRNTYHEFVMKRLLREAAENGYDSIGWTPSEVQSERWSDEFAEAYRIEYDQDIPKFMQKYGKQWGATVGTTTLENGTEVWSLDITDAMRDSVLHEGQPMYSQELPALEELRRENAKLTSEIEKLRRQNSLERKAKPQDIRSIAKELSARYNSVVQQKDIVPSMKAIADMLYDSKADESEIRMLATDVARKIVSGSKAVDDVNTNKYNAAKTYFRYNRINFNGLGIDNWAEIEKANRQHIKFGSTGVSVQTAYTQLQKELGEDLLPTDIEDAAEQVLKIIEVMSELRAIYQNPYSFDMAYAVDLVANDILDNLVSDRVREDVTRAQKDFAKRNEAQRKAKKDAEDAFVAGQIEQGRKMAEAQRKAKERQDAKLKRVTDTLAEVRRKRDEQLRQIVEHNKEKQAAKADSRTRTRLLKIARRLQNKKLPAVTRALLDQYIGEIDTVAKSLTNKKASDLRGLRDWYEDQKENNPDFIADSRIEKAIARLSKKQIADLSADEVAQLTEVLLNIENEIRTQRKLIDSTDRRDVYNMGVETIDNITQTKGNDPGLKGAVGRYIVTQTLSPVRQIRRMVGYADTDPLYKLTNALADGQRNMFDYQRRAGEKFLKWTQDAKFVESITGKKAETIKVVGTTSRGPATVEITPAMRMSLYLHSLNSDNLRHIAGGGITVPDINLYRKGKIAEAYARGTTIRLTPSQVRQITANMSAKERAFARAAHEYFNGMSQQEINAVSERLKGYSLALVEDYFPINTDTSFTKKEFDAIKFDGTIEGMGFLKERVNSASPIMLRDMNAVLMQSIDQTAKYVGLAIPVRNFNKVWGVTQGSYNADGSRNGFDSSVQQAVKKAWGEDGYRYIEKMMQDINGGKSTSENPLGKLINKAKSAYAGAVLTLSASVALKQAASYPTAAAVIGFKPLAKALKDFGSVDLDLIAKYTPLQWYRTQGFSTQELGDMAKKNKSLPKALNWVQGIDLLTTRKLWKAAEYYVQQENKALAVGSDAYYKAVANIYNRIIEETQPNYTTMQRPQLLRSDNALLQSLQMFKTQPFQNFNVLYDAFGNLNAKQRQHKNLGTEESAAALKEAKKAAAWAVTSQIVQTAVFAGMTLAWNAFRGKLDNYEDDDDDVTLLSLLGGYAKDMAGGVAAMVPFGSDLWEFVNSKVFDTPYYGIDAVAVTAISDTIESIGGTMDLVAEVSRDILDGNEVNWNEVRLSMGNYFDDISKLFGIPYESVMNLVNACLLNGAKAIQGKYVGTYTAMKLTTSPERYKKDYMDLLYNAYRNDRGAYKEIRRDMIRNKMFDTDKSDTEEIIDLNIERRKKQK